MRRVEKTDNLVLTALMTCLVCLATYALKIPNPLTQGYVHIGDTFIFMSVLVLGKKNSAIASAVGAAMADIMGGYAIFAIGTFFAKGLMAFVMGLLIEKGYERTVVEGHTKFLSSGLRKLHHRAHVHSRKHRSVRCLHGHRRDPHPRPFKDAGEEIFCLCEQITTYE